MKVKVVQIDGKGKKIREPQKMEKAFFEALKSRFGDKCHWVEVEDPKPQKKKAEKKPEVKEDPVSDIPDSWDLGDEKSNEK